VTAAHVTYGMAARSQQAAWHQVPAVLLTSAPVGVYKYGYLPTARAR
jgi:hypothetical protein